MPLVSSVYDQVPNVAWGIHRTLKIAGMACANDFQCLAPMLAFTAWRTGEKTSPVIRLTAKNNQPGFLSDPCAKWMLHISA